MIVGEKFAGKQDVKKVETRTVETAGSAYRE